MSKKRFVWVVTAKSESSDEYGPWVFEREPTDEQLEAFCRKECPQEFGIYESDEDDLEENDGPGDWGSYLHVRQPVRCPVQ
jgi:hypothetical protein